MRVGFVVNSRVKKKDAFYKQVSRAAERYPDVELVIEETSTETSAKTLARNMAVPVQTVIAVGGDGTLNEVVNGVVGTGASIGLLPMGTANDFSKTIPVPKSIEAIITSIKKQSTVPVDVGLVNYHLRNGTKKERYFINIADLGMGADVVNLVNTSKKRFGANLTFTSAIVKTFLSYKNQPIRCKADDWEWEGKINSLVVANGKYFGSGLCIAPNADPSSGFFEIVIIGDISLVDYLKNLPKIKRGEKIHHPELFYKKAASLSVEGINKPCAIEADGEFFGYTDVKVSRKDILHFIK